MAAGGLLALLDDIAVLLDDIAAMSQVAATKTAGIVGDDLAVSTQALVGIDPKRELPIVWKVAKGSLKNKFILVPAALFLSAFAEWSITPLLMIGGAFLCYEGAEKVIHAVRPTKEDEKHKKEITEASHVSADALVEVEKQKIAEAVNTDFILSAEIVVIALGTIKKELVIEGLLEWQIFAVQSAALVAIGIGMTVVVYGLVGCIIKMDDVGMYFAKKNSRGAQKFGHGILKMMPYFMKTLSVVGTAAMFGVGGGIILHGIPPIAHGMHGWGFLLNGFVSLIVGGVIGLVIVPVAHMLGAPCAALAGKVKAKIRKKPEA